MKKVDFYSCFESVMAKLDELEERYSCFCMIDNENLNDESRNNIEKQMILRVKSIRASMQYLANAIKQGIHNKA